jgi:hypothetical protein
MRVENGYTEAQEEQPYDEEKKATQSSFRRRISVD